MKQNKVNYIILALLTTLVLIYQGIMFSISWNIIFPRALGAPHLSVFLSIVILTMFRSVLSSSGAYHTTCSGDLDQDHAYNIIFLMLSVPIFLLMFCFICSLFI